jgi:hypothetical protein
MGLHKGNLSKVDNQIYLIYSSKEKKRLPARVHEIEDN